MSFKTDLCVKVLQWEDRCTEAMPLSWPGKSWSSGSENRYDGRPPGCSGWPGLLWVPHPALGAPTTLAVTCFSTVGSSGEHFLLFRRELCFVCSRADTAQSKLTEGFETRRLASSPKPIPRVLQLLHATATGSHKWELGARGGPVADEQS